MLILLRVLEALKWLVIVDAVLSWVVAPGQFPRSLTQTLLAPVYAPIHALIGRYTGPIDLAPLIVLGLLFALQRVVQRAARGGR